MLHGLLFWFDSFWTIIEPEINKLVQLLLTVEGLLMYHKLNEYCVDVLIPTNLSPSSSYADHEQLLWTCPALENFGRP